MGYLFIICLIIISAIILATTTWFDYKRIKKEYDQALIEAKSWGRMIGRR